MNKSLEINLLHAHHAKDLFDLINSESNDYLKYFIPFQFDLNTIHKILSDYKFDKYFGLFVDKKLIGLYMLRGLDEGYITPSYGVYISSKFKGKGIAKLTLQHAISICKLNKLSEMILKVHPENLFAKKMYEDFGFKYVGLDNRINNIIYKIEISEH